MLQDFPNSKVDRFRACERKDLTSFHIMHVVDSLALGGAERMLVEIANRSAADGYRVSVCVTRSGCALASTLRPEIGLQVLDRRRRFDWAAIRRFAALVRDQHVDLLHAHGRSTFSFLAMTKSIGLIKAPIVLHDHYGSIEFDTSIPLWFRLWAKRWASHYVGVYTKLVACAEAAGISREKISVIDNALDLSRIQLAAPLDVRKEFGIEDDAAIGIVVGSLRWDKGIDLLLEAVARSSYRRSAKFLIVGGERDKVYAQACRAQSASLGLGDNVIFVGERSDVPGLLRGADFALIPSRSESGPLVLIEHMASGLPIVSSRVGSIAQRVADLGLPEFVAPDNTTAFAKALDRLLSLSPCKRRERGKVGQDIALRNFDIRQTMPQWYEVYAAALEAV